MDLNESVALRAHQKRLIQLHDLFGAQLIAVLIQLLSILAVNAINHFWPDFFPYTYLSWQVTWENLSQFWPMLIWGFVVSVLMLVGGGHFSSSYDEPLLVWDLITSWMAAVWEELAFRWTFICFGMIAVMALNWFFGTVLGWVLAVFFTTVTFTLFREGELLSAIVGLLLVGACVSFALIADPLYWLYLNVLMPLVNLASFGSYADIVDPNKHPSLLVMGAIVANAWFRDGHKYQGSFGLMHSWVIGFVFLYAVLTYGLMTAVVLHGLWNSHLAVMQYLLRKLSRQ